MRARAALDRIARRRRAGRRAERPAGASRTAPPAAAWPQVDLLPPDWRRRLARRRDAARMVAAVACATLLAAAVVAAGVLPRH